ARRRFRREIEAVSRIDHPNICTVYEAGEIQGSPYVAMRYVDGPTLAQLIADGVPLHPVDGSGSTSALSTTSRRGVDSVVQMFERIAFALHTAHEKGVLHRDIKPGNIIIDDQANPVLLDFGLAAPEELAGDQLTASADQIGTPAYMSPEQVQGQVRSLDRRCDVYALGVTMYEFLVGAHPFESPTRDLLYQRILDGRCTPLDKVRPDLPSDLAVVVQTAMARDPDRRYDSADAFAADLRRVRLRQPISARRPSSLQRMVRWCQREPLVAGLVAALTLISVASIWLAVAAERSRRGAEVAERVRAAEAEHARQQAATSGRVTEFLVDLFQVADGSEFRGARLTARELLDQGYRRIEQELAEEPQIRARLMLTMGQVYQHLGVFDRAAKLFDGAYELRSSRDASVVERAECLRLRGELEHLQQHAEVAERSYSQALTLLEADDVPHPRDHARTLDLLGRARRDLGDLDGAVRLHERALTMRRSLVGEPLELAESHQSLAMLAVYRADHEVAIREFRAAIEIRRRELGPQSGRMPELLHGLGMVYLGQGALEQGQRTIADALALTRRVFGDGHHGVGYCLAVLGNIAAESGDRELAERH
ncbi:MAG: serine/threonine protein kinase, partial [Planctomycetes bacterium]|nr:serine/threonine protein kinase [Planctomycetota bacterium]